MGESNYYIATTGERWAPLEYGALCVFGPGGRAISSSEIIAELRTREDHARRLFTALAACVAERERELGDYKMRDIWSGASQAAAALLEELRASYGEGGT